MAADRKPEPIIRRSLAADIAALRAYNETHPLPTGGLTVVGPAGEGRSTTADPEEHITELCRRNPCM